MKTTRDSTLIEPVYFQTVGPLLLAGLRRHYTDNDRNQIPLLWHEVGPFFGKIASQSGDGYGICTRVAGKNGGFDYMAAMEVANVQNLPVNWISMKIPSQRYAVFNHPGHVSEISATVRDAFESWLPRSGSESMSGRPGIPDFLEHYGKGYDPKEGTGDIEVWLPVKG